jgi:hypothetical protein
MTNYYITTACALIEEEFGSVTKGNISAEILINKKKVIL